MPFVAKRIYEPASSEDGVRVLVDRLWPRGVRREQAAIDAWMKELAPSHELRKWFAHEAAKWESFLARYRDELQHSESLAALRALGQHQRVTLLYAARDEAHNNAVALLHMLEILHR